MSHTQLPINSTTSNLPHPSPNIAPEQLKQKIETHAKHIFTDWHDLNAIILRHEDLIRKRWLKKTRDQKKTSLVKAWGNNISVSHRPDLQFHLDGNNKDCPHPNEAYKWPYINLEDLLKPKVLLIFLNNRGRTPPDVFLNADLRACHLGRACGKLETIRPDKHHLLFKWTQNPDTYGEVIPTDGKNSAEVERKQTRLYLEAGDGVLVLEIQERIYQFLVSTAKDLLHDISADKINEAPIQSEPPKLSLDDSVIFHWASAAIEAPYHKPVPLDIARLKTIISTRKSAVADHLWMLREDPSYFVDYVNECKEHQPEMLPDASGKKHNVQKLGLTPAFWNRVLSKMVVDDCMALALWNAAYQQASNLETVLRKHTKASHHETYSNELRKAVLEFQCLLQEMSALPIRALQYDVPPSPPMRHLWYRENASPAGEAAQNRVVPKPREDKDPSADRLLKMYFALWDEDQRSKIGLDTLVSELDRLSYDDSTAKELQSSRVLSALSDLGVISECLQRLSLNIPWLEASEHESQTRIKQAKDELAKDMTEWARYQAIPWPGTELADLGTPSGVKFNYPIGQIRNRTNITVMRKAEHNLDAFWVAVDSNYAANPSALQQKVMKLMVSENYTLQRTPEWVEAGKKGGKSATAQQATEPDDVPISRYYLQLRPRKRPGVSHALPIRAQYEAKDEPKVEDDIVSNGQPISEDTRVDEVIRPIDIETKKGELPSEPDAGPGATSDDLHSADENTDAHKPISSTSNPSVNSVPDTNRTNTTPTPNGAKENIKPTTKTKGNGKAKSNTSKAKGKVVSDQPRARSSSDASNHRSTPLSSGKAKPRSSSDASKPKPKPAMQNSANETQDRPTSASSSDSPSKPTQKPSNTPSPISVNLDKRSKKVLTWLFSVGPNATDTPTEIQWQDFVHTMQSLDIVAEKLHGSIWHFAAVVKEKKKADEKMEEKETEEEEEKDVKQRKTIQVPEPFPRGKVTGHGVRRLARRLTRTFGWDGAMFGLT